MESDAYFRDGGDRGELEREVTAKVDEIRRAGGEVGDISLTATHRGEQPWFEARFDYRMPAGEIAEEVEYDPDSVEDPA